MKQIKFWTLTIFAISLLLVSCGETVDESQVLVEYLESADSPIDVTKLNKLIKATELQTEILTGNPYIIDIRGDEYNTLGHIDGAVQVAATDVLSHLDALENASSYSKIVVVCYTGQTSAYFVSLANMAGHNVWSLLWGMSAWNDATAGPWNNNIKNTYATQLEITTNPKGEEGALPVIETGYETAEDILAARIAEVNAAGFSPATITADVVWANPENYYIVNYWPLNQYEMGHITGAIQYTPGVDILTTSYLKTLPTDKPIVVYCYTGTGSAFLSAYLRVLNYDSRSLMFGINGMARDWAADNQLTNWNEGHIAGNDLVTE
ncbi:MAG: rhodanese-like domain-containing protein [Bacteroidales bacterium]